MNLPTEGELNQAAMFVLASERAGVPCEFTPSFAASLIRAARLAVEGQERAKIVIDAVRKERDWFDRRHRLARGTYGYNGEYERKSSALTHTLGMIDQALAHLDEKHEPTESEARK